MKLIARKPCNFGGQQFFIGSEIPENLVADVNVQEKLGVITVIQYGRTLVKQVGVLFSQEEVNEMIADAVAEAEQQYTDKIAKLEETEGSTFTRTVTITLKSDRNEQNIDIMATPEEIQQSFAILQMNAEEGVKAIADVKRENVLIIVHAIDSRKTVKEAARKQADNLFSTDGDKNEISNGKQSTSINTEGSDT